MASSSGDSLDADVGESVCDDTDADNKELVGAVVELRRRNCMFSSDFDNLLRSVIANPTQAGTRTRSPSGTPVITDIPRADAST